MVAAALLVSTVPGMAAGKPEGIPVRVRMVLLQVQPLMEKKAYGSAAEKVRSFLPPPNETSGSRQVKNSVYAHYLLYFTLGNCEFLMARYPEAIDAYQAAIQLKPAYPPAWFNLARANYELERFAKAGNCFISGYDRAVEREAQPLYYAASCFNLAQQYDRSRAVFERLLKNHPADVQPAWKGVLVQALLALNQPRQALPHIEELAGNADSDELGQWQALLFSQYMELGMNDRARGYATELTMTYPLEPRWWKALAHLETAVGDYRAALVAMTVYRSLIPFSPSEKKLVADLYLQEDIPAKAVPMYASLLADGHDPLIAEKISRCYLKLDRPDRALEWIDRALSQHPGEKLFTMKGDILYEQKRYKDAYTAFEAAVRLKGKTSGRAWLMMGYCALNAGDYVAAEKALTVARDYTGEKQAALTALTYLKHNQAKQE